MAYYYNFIFRGFKNNIGKAALGLLVLTLSACSSPASKQNTNDTVSVADSSSKHARPMVAQACFSRGEGKNNEDMTIVQLKIVGDSINGQMTWLPYQKDSRKGTLKGTKSGNEIRAVWQFTQEGMTDTLAMQFKLSGDKLLQKPLTLDQKSGRQITDAKAGYQISFNTIDCGKVWIK